VLALAVASVAGAGGLGIGLSSVRPAGRPVAVKLSFSSILQCGLPLGAPITVTFPAAERIPSKITARAVLVNRSAAESVAVSGHVVTIKVAPPEVICMVIARGPVTIAFTRAANLGNPGHAGAYRISVDRGRQTVTGTFSIQK
jgi:hypothetical protein